MITFPVSGVQTHWWLPPAVAFGISFLTSMGGVSGAFLLLPFQVSVLGFTSPAVSPTNLVFNLVAIPGGVARYLREGRLLWPLTWVIVAGTLPGMVAGGLIRLHWLSGPREFKAFVGAVLLYIGLRVARELVRRPAAGPPAGPGADGPGPAAGRGPATGAGGPAWRLQDVDLDWRRLAYRFQGRRHEVGTAGLVGVSLVIGLVGGIYGIGGGAILAPLLVAIWRLPVHTIAGATLTATFLTSVGGVAFFQLAALAGGHGQPVAPDWLLGGAFGLGGIAGMYLGARTQRRVPAGWIKAFLAVVLLWTGGRYLLGLLFR